MTCQRCHTPTPQKLCHSCAVQLSNPKRPGKFPGLMSEEIQRCIVERREWSKAISGLAKDKVPIAKINWLERPMP